MATSCGGYIIVDEEAPQEVLCTIIDTVESLYYAELKLCEVIYQHIVLFNLCYAIGNKESDKFDTCPHQ